MEKISKIYALTVDRTYGNTGDGGNCKVVAYSRNNEFVKDPEKISSYFITNSMIFSNKLYYEIPDLTTNQLVEITVKNFIDEVTEGKNIYVGFKTVKKTGNIVIDIPSEYFNESYIDLIQISKYLELNNYLERDLGNFYLCDNFKLYGPFKISNGLLQSKESKHVNAFEYKIEELIEVEGCEFSYIIAEPKNKFAVLDCMSDHQLIEFLKEQLSIDRADINLIKKTADHIVSLNSGRSELDSIRLSRASKVLNNLIFSYDELKKICTKNHEWSQLTKKVLEEHKDIVKTEALEEIENEIKQHEISKSHVIIEIQNKKKEIENLKNDCIEISKQYEKISKNKEDLILTIQIAAGSNPNGNTSTVTTEKRFYEVTSENKPSVFNELDDFYEACLTKVKNKKVLQEVLSIFKEKKFIIGSSVELVINAIQHIGTYQMMLQNAEADWLKFSSLEQNGLGYFATEAAKNPSVPFFYILQDFNIASFECYGRPINDLANGIRRNIPGSPQLWPENLHFIMITTQSDVENFGFALNKSTFSNWSFCPETDNYFLQSISREQGINLHDLKVYSQYDNHADKYFI